MRVVLASVQTSVLAPMQETQLMAQVHVLTGPERRRFSLEQKRAMVAAAFAPGAVVADVARRADVCSSLIYRWRRELGVASHGFAEVILAPGVAGGDGADDAEGLAALPSAVACFYAAPLAWNCSAVDRSLWDFNFIYASWLVIHLAVLPMARRWGT
jgi:transposase